MQPCFGFEIDVPVMRGCTDGRVGVKQNILRLEEYWRSWGGLVDANLGVGGTNAGVCGAREKLLPVFQGSSCKHTISRNSWNGIVCGGSRGGPCGEGAVSMWLARTRGLMSMTSAQV